MTISFVFKQELSIQSKMSGDGKLVESKSLLKNLGTYVIRSNREEKIHHARNRVAVV